MTERSTTPWTPRAGLAAAAGVIAGGALVLIGALGAASEDNLPDEIPWFNAGVCGLIVAGATIIAWLLAGRRAVTAARNRVVVLYAVDLEPGGFGSVADAQPGQVAEVVTVPGSTWYHRTGCLLTAGKPLLPIHTDDGLSPCVVCSR